MERTYDSMTRQYLHGRVPWEENTTTTGKDVEGHVGGRYWKSINHAGRYSRRVCLRSPLLSPLILRKRYARKMTMNEKSKAFHIYITWIVGQGKHQELDPLYVRDVNLWEMSVMSKYGREEIAH